MIKILCVGKIKEDYLKAAIKEYEKRLSKYTKLTIIELPDFGDLPSSKAIIKEGEEIEKHIDDKDYIITLELDGKSLDSLTFAKVIDNTFSHYASITFVIGGSDGLSNKTKDRANMALSFSSMTFPHQLFRVMLLEQIYRSYKINNNETYHK